MADNKFGLTDEQVARNRASGGSDLSITANKLGVTESPIDIPQVQEPPVPVLTALEKEAQGITDKANQAKTELLGETAFRSNLETGLDDKEQEVQTRLNEFNEIVTEQKLLSEQMQQASEGRGRTVGGLRPLETARNRDIAIRGLFAQSKLEVAQGNLTKAKTSIDRAVAAKFDPIRQELATQLLQLEIITPRLVGEQKQRAEAQKARIAAETKRVEKEEAEQVEINEIWAEVARLDGGKEMMDLVLNSKSLQEAMFHAGPILGTEFADELKQKQFNRDLAVANFDLAVMRKDQSWDLAIAKMKQDKEFHNETMNARTAERFAKDAKEEKAEAITNEANAEKALGIVASIDALLEHPGLSSSVGANPAARISAGNLITGNKTDFINDAEQLKNWLTLDNMSLMTGVLSESDIKILASAATSLDFKTSEKRFVEELEKLRAAAQRAVDKSGVTAEQAQFYYALTEEELLELETFFPNGITKTQLSSPFNPEAFFTNND